jgi:subfamily B ATP-binding cassette protein MsbA
MDRRQTEARYLRRLAGYLLANKGLLLITVVMGIVGFAITFIFPWVIGSLFDYVILAKPPKGGAPPTLEQRWNWLLVLFGISVVTAFLFAVAGFCRGHYNMKLGNRIVTAIRHDLFEHLQKLSLYFYAHERTGGIVWRLVHDVHGVNGLIHAGGILVFLDVLQLGITVTLLWAIDPKLTMAVLVILPLYMFVFKIFNPFVRDITDKVNRHIGKISGNVHEQFANIPLVKSYANEDRETEKFMNDFEDHYKLVARQSHIGHASGAISELLIHFGTCIIVIFGGYLALYGKSAKPIDIGDLVRFIGYVGILYGPVKRFADLNLVYQNSLSSMRRVFRIFDITPRILEKPNAIDTPPQRCEIRLENVRFYYGEHCDETTIRLDYDEPDDSPFLIKPEDANDPSKRQPRWVLDGINMIIEAGQRVALVGPSGCGKSTLATLLPRLYDAIEGRITIDGIDVRDYTKKAIRTTIATVQQESFIFSGTIKENIVYGRPDASMDQVIAAAKAANAHEFIMATPLGYDTILGERGINLSGGQKQRLSIARALLKDPKILILDEATSSLDAESEALVQEALERLMEGRTCLIIAHRLSTIRNCDRIFALKEGRIVESGRHDELIDRNGLYATLVRKQWGMHKLPKPLHPGDDAPTPARKKRRRGRKDPTAV